jgi:hypothetical protein
VAVFRDRQVWPNPNGRMTRIHVMANRTVETVHSDDNFQAWEAEHVISR